MADTHLIEVRAGRAEPPSLELRPGVELAPLSVGTGGAWQVNAPGVRPVHLYIYFDGQTLFLQSAEPADPPQMDGRPLPGSWTPATPRCTITFGQARLAFRPADPAGSEDEQPTVAQPLPEERRPEPAPPRAVAPKPAPVTSAMPARPFKPGAFAATDDGESTRLQPVEMEDYGGPPSSDSTRIEPLGAATDRGGAMAAVRPAAGAPWNRPSPIGPTVPLAAVAPPAGGFQPSRPFAPQPLPPTPMPTSPADPTAAAQRAHDGPPSGLLNVPPPSVRKPDAPEAFPAMLKREWESAPPLRKALIGAMPIAVLMALWLVVAGGAPPPPPKPTPVATTAPTTPPPPTAVVPTQAPTVWPPPMEPVPVPPVPPPHPAVVPSASASAAANSATGDAGAANVDRRERQAADLVATHNYDQAIRIYDQLAAERPQNPAFHEAARILRGKLGAGTP
jgi:hypothetical protein